MTGSSFSYQSCQVCSEINSQPEKPIETIIRSSLESNLQIIIFQTKLLKEKDRLRKFCHKEVEMLLKKKNLKQKEKKLIKMHC